MSSTDLVRWQDTPRLYVVVCEKPKSKKIPKRRVFIDTSMELSNKLMDGMRMSYERRIGYSVVGMFPHTHIEKEKITG